MIEGPDATFPTQEELDRLVQTRPADALAVTKPWLEGTSAGVVTTGRAWGVAARALFELGQIDAAASAVRKAIEVLESSDEPDVVALRLPVALSSAAILVEAGLFDEAVDRLDAIEVMLEPQRRGRIRMQRSYVLAHAGRLTDALEQVELAEPLLSAEGDELGLLRLTIHRGVVQLQRGYLDAAETDFRLADELAVSLGQTAMRAGIASNLGAVLGRQRRLRDALEQFDRAREIHAAVGQPGRMVAVTEIDRAEVLMHAGLVVDAVEAAENAVRNVEPTGNQVVLGDSQLLLARALLAAERSRSAGRMAAAAVATFRSAGRSDMVPQARAVESHAALAAATDGEAILALIDRSAALVAELVANGWFQLADELRMSRVRAAHRVGVDSAVADDVATLRLGAFSERRDVALAGWYCEAIARARDGEVAHALDACRAGLDRLDDIVLEAPTLNERSAAMRIGNDLSQLTIELAVLHGDAETALAAAEGTRARALHEELSEHRRHDPLTTEGAVDFHRELGARLGDRVLVEWIVVGDSVWAVVVDAGGARLVEVAAIGSVRRARDRLLVWLDRAAAEPDGPSVAAMNAAAAVDELLLGPLGLPDEPGVVMVPEGLLHGLPWSGLPSLAGRPFVLVPNARLWLASDRRAVGAGHSVGLVVGPDVDGSEGEREAIERWHVDAAVAAGPGATSATVRSMFGGVDVVHVAAHGRFRSDHPLLSTLRLHDGEATMYDAIPDRISARLVVLSSCEGGAHGTADGSEVLGLSAVMLAKGAASVMAPLTVVRDLECAEFVAEVHGELARGEPVACAVANVRGRWLGDDDLSRWAVASSFTCFGSGAVTIG